jgi:Ca-activated chloride channel homolog
MQPFWGLTKKLNLFPIICVHPNRERNRNPFLKEKHMKTIISIATLLLILGAVQVAGQSDIGDIGQGSLFIRQEDPEETQLLSIPLEHTSVQASISGFIARVTVTQTFGNNLDHSLEAIYVFPLPDQAAVDDMTMHVGTRTIKGVIKKREEAQRLYNQAKQNGQTASLLTQERPNIFTQSVANILPGDDIRIEISYVQDLRYDQGAYEFNFPMVVGPRFNPGQPVGKMGGGWSSDTNIVPDASRITPPVLTPGTRSGHDIEITIRLEAGVPITQFESPSHRIHMDRIDESEAIIELDASDTIPNKDFILRYKVAGKLPESAVLTHAGAHGGFFSIMIQPQADFSSHEVTPKEMIFVVDCSGSMSGAPMAKAKEAMRRSIAGMNPNDSFQIIRFSSSASKFSPRPIPNTPGNIQKALSYIDAMAGSGGTMMIEGIKAALDYPADPARLRIVLFMTDGYIGNETQILAAIEQKLNRARLFSFGVGSSVNHYLLDRMAEAGRGTVQYVRPDEETESAVSAFYNRICNPLLTDIELDWDGIDVTDVYPAVIPDLFSAQPVIIHGRYEEAGSGAVTISARFRGRIWEQDIDVVFPEVEPDHDVLATLWARQKIKTLMADMYGGEKPQKVREVTQLALEFRIMSQYTAFVAVTEEIRTSPGGWTETIQIPVEIPDMVSYEGIFGQSACEKECGTLNRMMPSVSGKGRIMTKKSRYSMAAGAATTCIDKDETIAREEICSGDPAEPTHHKAPVFACRIRMLSGSISRYQATKSLEKIQLKIENILVKYGSGRLILKLRIDRNGAVEKIEFLKNSYPEDVETRLVRLLKKSIAFSGKSGNLTLEISMS